MKTSTHSHLLTEWIFIIISLVVAGIGILLGFLFYVWRPYLPDIWAQRLRPLYLASYNKYWVDEFYGWAITRRTMDAARAIYAFDSKLVDGIVNGLAWLSRQFSVVVGAFDKYFVDGLVNTICCFHHAFDVAIVPRCANGIHTELRARDGVGIDGRSRSVFRKGYRCGI